MKSTWPLLPDCSHWLNGVCSLYYQKDPARLSTCPVTIHALLHIADGIESCGPVWAYWAFPMERYCGFLGRCIKSRRFPFANLDSYCLSLAQLTQIRNRYNKHKELTFKVKRAQHLRSETPLVGECEFVSCQRPLKQPCESDTS